MRCEPDSTPGQYAAAFSSGLLDPAHPAPALVVAGAGKGVTRRYNVYRNNVTVSLITALTDIYPAIERITGADFFREMARAHVRATPPTSRLLFDYGRDFPAFIASYAYASEMPWLADTARIERAWLDAYHAADMSVLGGEALAALDPASLMDVRFVPHPAVQVIRSRYPAVDIFAMNKSDGVASPIDVEQAQDALVSRPQHDVMVSRLPDGGATFLIHLLQGASLGLAATAAFDEAPSFDLPANLAGMISAGVFAAIRHGD
jgi:hypothetical protein